MTKQRIYEGGTEFSIWIRQQQELDSQLSYHCYDVDYIWTHFQTGQFMLIEEKRYGWDNIKAPAHYLFARLNKLCSKDTLYRGYHLICFENTSPENGKIQINHKDITKEDLLKFLQFDPQVLLKYTKGDFVSQKLVPKIVDHLKKLRK